MSNQVEEILELFGVVEHMSPYSRPKSNMPYDVRVLIEIIEIYETLEKSDQAFVQDTLTDSVRKKLLYLSKLAVEKAIETKCTDLISVGLIAHIIEGFTLDYRENYRYLIFFCYAATRLETSIHQLLVQLHEMMSQEVKEMFFGYIEKSCLDKEREAYQIKEQYVDGKLTLIPPPYMV
ncbi:MAG: hypothetical protein K0U47_08260 [Epsilonproteobacteria bacterium]|nr:hypothetical protein [Campylobacterota bacterium]